MKLVGPWVSGYTRRTGITMKLLGIPFDHININAYVDKDEVRHFSPMCKVPALVLDNEEVLLDSSMIIDYIYEIVGPDRALLAPFGPYRREALQITGIGSAIYGKLLDIYEETFRPTELQSAAVIEGCARQVLSGFDMLEAKSGSGWLVEGKLGQADIMSIVAFQTANSLVLPNSVTSTRFPGLAALTDRAMQLDPFSSTVPI